ncbi:MAG: hypothetical protein WCO79_01650 [bacterium]
MGITHKHIRMPTQHIIDSVRRNLVFLGSRQMGVELSTVHFEGTGFAVDGQFAVTSLDVFRAMEKGGGQYFAGVYQKTEAGTDVYQTADLMLIDTDIARGLAVFGFEQRQEIGFSMDDLETNEDCLTAGVEAFTLSFPATGRRTEGGVDAKRIAVGQPKIFTHLCSIGAVQKDQNGVPQLIELDGAPWLATGGAPLIDIDSSKVLGVVVGTVDVFVRGSEPVCLSHRIPTVCPSTVLYDVLDEVSAVVPGPSSDSYDDEDAETASLPKGVAVLRDELAEEDEYEYGYGSGYGKMKE